MRKKMFRKVTAIMMAAAMMSSGYTMVSADDFTDQEVQTEAAVEDIAVESTEEAVAEETPEADVQIEEEAPAEESESAEVTFEDETTDAFSDGTDPADFAETEVEAEVEVTSYKTDFCFENEEVVITASVSEDAELPENAEMKAEKLEAGSEKYEEAKQASMRDLGTSEDAEYTFYDVTFTVDGNEVELPEKVQQSSTWNSKMAKFRKMKHRAHFTLHRQKKEQLHRTLQHRQKMAPLNL